MPLREERRRVDRPARPEVQHRKVGRLPRFDASRKSEDPARVRRHQVDQPFQRQNQGGGMTKDQIMGIRDASERQAAIAANMHLFSKGE